MKPPADINVILLHENMLDKHGKVVTTSITTIDVHDVSRSARTFGCTQTFVAHPSPTLQQLALTMRTHWQSGFGSTYNPNRSDALNALEIVSSLDNAIGMLQSRTGKAPLLVGTSAKPGGTRITFPELRAELPSIDQPILLMFGTGWGMTDDLLSKVDRFLTPIQGPSDYNHLSVRSAVAIVLDRLLGLP